MPALQPQKTQQSSKKSFKFQKQNSNFILVTLTTIIGVLNFALVSTSTTVNINVISAYYNRTISSVQWLIHIESLFSTCCSAISGQIISRFGLQICYFFGLSLTCVTTILSGIFAYNFFGLLILRAFSSIGSSMLLVTGIPIQQQFVRPNDIGKAVQIQSLGIPIGSIIASFIAGVIAQYSEWYYIYYIAGCICFAILVYSIFMLPQTQRNKDQRINWLCCGILLLSVALIIFSLTALSQTDLFPWWTFLITLPIGICLMVLFFKLNQKTDNKIFYSELFNKSTIISYLCYILSIISTMSDRLYQSVIWMKKFEFSSTLNGVLIGITKVTQVPSVFFIQFCMNRCTYRWNAQFTLIVSIICNLVSGLCLRYFANVFVIEIVNILQCITFVQHLTVMQTMTVKATPQKYSQNAVTLVSVISTLGQSLGMSISVCLTSILYQGIQGLFNNPEKEYFQAITWTYYANGIIALIGIILSKWYGIYSWERGKIGFREKLFMNTKTYKDYLQNNNNEYVEVNKVDMQKLESQMEDEYNVIYNNTVMV